MTGLVADVITKIATPRQPEIREYCLAALALEIRRAENEVFSDAAPIQPTPAYCSAFDNAKRAQKRADTRPWLNHTALELPRHWLTLIGYRICLEGCLMLGGIDATRVRAAEVLGTSQLEALQWDIDLLFAIYGNTQLRSEWQYEGEQFRFETALQ